MEIPGFKSHFSSHFDAGSISTDSFLDLWLAFYATPSLFLPSVAVLLLALSCLFTFIGTTLQDGKPTALGEPPVAPYWLPYLGHIQYAIRDFGSYLDWLKARKPGNRPYTLFMASQTMYIVLDQRTITKVHRNQKSVAFEPLALHILSSVFKGPPEFIEALEIGAHGFPIDPKIKIAKKELEDNAILTRISKQYGKYLQKDHLKVIAARYVAQVNATLLSDPSIKPVVESKDGTWHQLDMVAFIKHIIFVGASTAVFGTKLLELAGPTFEADLWKFDQSFQDFASGYPKFMTSSAYTARERVLNSFKKWQTLAYERAITLEDDVEWDEVCGSKLCQERLKLFNTTLSDVDPAGEGRAANHLGLYWAVQANTNPFTFWALIYILFSSDPNLLPSVLSAIESCHLPSSVAKSLPTFDIPRLTSLPLINAIHQETLRLSVSSISARFVIEDTVIDGYTYKAGGILQLPGTTLQYDPEFWGPDVAEFNHNRFFPVNGETEAEATKRTMDQQAHMKPFGGGATMCPGRFFAAQEVWASVAVLLAAFEWDVKELPRPQMDWSRYGLGALSPKKGLIVGIRKRAGW